MSDRLTVTVEEAKEQKHTLEQQIYKLVRAYQERTGVNIEGIRLHGARRMDGRNQLFAVQVEAEL